MKTAMTKRRDLAYYFATRSSDRQSHEFPEKPEDIGHGNFEMVPQLSAVLEPSSIMSMSPTIFCPIPTMKHREKPGSSRSKALRHHRSGC